MCHCDPRIRTPFCGKLGCVSPKISKPKRHREQFIQELRRNRPDRLMARGYRELELDIPMQSLDHYADHWVQQQPITLPDGKYHIVAWWARDPQSYEATIYLRLI